MRSVRCVVMVAVIALTAGQGLAVTPGQTDTFQDGTFNNWTNGPVGLPPTNVASGGPAGAGDRFLSIISNNHLAIFNLVQWSGDYAGAGVLDIEVDFKNPNATPVQMRAVLFGPTGSRWSSAVAQTVPADNAWHHYTFSLRASDLLNVLPVGEETYAQTIVAVERLLFRHEVTPSAGGTPYIGSLGIDNVHAIPEPASLASLILGGVLLRHQARRRC